MGRFDLARQNLEAALAISPNDPGLLSALAISLDRQGLQEEAAEVRAEVTQLQSASAALDAPDVEPEPQAAVAADVPARPATKLIPASPAVAAPVVRPAPAGSTVTVKLSPARPVRARYPFARLQCRPSQACPAFRRNCRKRLSHTLRAFAPRPDSARGSCRGGVGERDVALPPARPVEVAFAQVRPRPPHAPLQLPEAVVDVRSEFSPHLERMSPGEVALITYEQPTAWRPRSSRALRRRRPSAGSRFERLRHGQTSAF